MGDSETSDENIIRQLGEDTRDYYPLNKDRLVLFAVDYLDSKGIEPTFDKVVAATFRLFPRKFALVGFPEYPDGRTIYYCVYNHCTLTKKWLSGNVQSGFKLTEKGKYFLEETKKMLKGLIKVKGRPSKVVRRKETTFLNLLKRTYAYRKFESGNMGEIDMFDIKEAFGVSPGSESSLLVGNLEKYQEYANRLDDNEVKEFLAYIKNILGE